MERIYLLDAYALIYRSYYAFLGRPMRNRQGLNTSAISSSNPHTPIRLPDDVSITAR